MERENKYLEYKKTLTDSAMKTVSAYANYGTGRIIFGINDDHSVAGIENPVEFCLRVENKINDNLSPIPHYNLKINEENLTVVLTVYKGDSVPYLFQGWAYIRNDSSTLKVDQSELQRLSLKGIGKTFDLALSSQRNLTFETLTRFFKDKVGLETISKETLISLHLENIEEEFTNAAELLSDQNQFLGIDFVIYGDDETEIKSRELIENCSVLKQFEEGVRQVEKNYTWQVIRGIYREQETRVPLTAFREAFANAIVHRDWMIHSRIRLSLFKDRVEIQSPGSLPEGMSEDDYLNRGISVLRNPNLSYVFYRLSLIEMFGSGIRNIKNAYRGKLQQPSFRLDSNRITVVLPVIQTNQSLTSDQTKILGAMNPNIPYSTKELSAQTGFNLQKTRRILQDLNRYGQIRKEGNTHSVRWVKE